MQKDCAILVLSANWPIGLRPLTTYFGAAGMDIYIHVDARLGIETFGREVDAGSRVIFIEDRVPVFWRGFSMVEATMKLILAAKNKIEYSRYMLISDDTLPLIPLSALNEKLRGVDEFTDAGPGNRFFERYDRFYMFDSGATSFRWVPLEDREITEDMLAKFRRLDACRKIGKKPLNQLFHGSQWWCLTAEAVQFVVNSWNNDDWLRESFEFSEVPDEHYIQTIVAESLKTTPKWFMYTDWSGAEKPKKFMTTAELPEYDSRVGFFVRKSNVNNEDAINYVKKLLY